MSKVIGPFRHIGSLGTLGGGTFIPSSGARDAIHPEPAAPSGLVSATSGYIRDSAGNRVRPMTPADLNAIADKHYGRVRP